MNQLFVLHGSSNIYAGTDFLTQAIKRASAYILLPSFDTVVIYQLIQRCLRAEKVVDAQIVAYNSQIIAGVANVAVSASNATGGAVVEGWPVRTIMVGNTDTNDCFTDSDCSNIHINASWFSEINMLDYDHVNVDLHIATLVLKLIHEYVQTLTPFILQEEQAIRVAMNQAGVVTQSGVLISTVHRQKTRTKVGFRWEEISKKTKKYGDMGFAAEEIMCNHQLIRGPVSKTSWNFTTLVPVTCVGETFHEYSLNKVTQTAWVDCVLKNDPVRLSDFALTLGDLPKRKSSKRTSLGNVKVATEEVEEGEGIRVLILMVLTISLAL